MTDDVKALVEEWGARRDTVPTFSSSVAALAGWIMDAETIGDRLAAALIDAGAQGYVRGLLRGAEIVGKRAHMSELMDGDPTVGQVLRSCEAIMQGEASALTPTQEEK